MTLLARAARRMWPAGRRALQAIAPTAEAVARRVPASFLYAGAIAAIATHDLPHAIEVGEELFPDGALARVALAKVYERAGAITRPRDLLDRVPVGRRPSRLDTRLQVDAGLLDRDFEISPRAAKAWDGGRRVLYHASQSLPHHSSGYATRTHHLVRALRAGGWDVEVHTRLGYPNDRYDHLGAGNVAPSAQIDGVPYRFAPDRAHGQSLDHLAYQRAAVESLIARARVLQPAIVHAASNHIVGLAGVEAARRLGLPSIYEVRGLWHLTRAASQPEYAGSEHYQLIERLEARAAAAADHVFVITEAVGEVLAALGVPRSKITLLPNAVDTAKFAPRPRDRELAAQWGIGDRPVIGYIGSFKRYEGLDLLLDAAERLRSRFDFRVLLIGDGEAEAELRARAGANVIMPGRLPHDTIARAYSVIDVLAFPRRGLAVCEAVSPLKPFEAMAMEKTVVVSDVAALTEIVRHDDTGLVHRKDDAASLADQLARCLSSPTSELALRGARWVREHRSWERVAAEVEAVYRGLAP